MVLELTLLQENFLDSTFGNGSFRNISDEIKEELKNKSRDNIIGINNFLENFGIDQEKLTEYKDMPIYKSENGFYYYNFEKRLLPALHKSIPTYLVFQIPRPLPQ